MPTSQNCCKDEKDIDQCFKTVSGYLSKSAKMGLQILFRPGSGAHALSVLH